MFSWYTTNFQTINKCIYDELDIEFMAEDYSSSFNLQQLQWLKKKKKNRIQMGGKPTN